MKSGLETSRWVRRVRWAPLPAVFVALAMLAGWSTMRSAPQHQPSDLRLIHVSNSSGTGSEAAPCQLVAGKPTARPDPLLFSGPLPCLGPGPDSSPAGLTGRPTIMTLWASWCQPCREELPLFQQLSTEGNKTGRFRVVGVASQDTRQAAAALVDDLGLTFPSLFDPKGEQLKASGAALMPRTLLIRSDGSVAYVVRRPVTDLGELESLVTTHLGVHA